MTAMKLQANNTTVGGVLLTGMLLLGLLNISWGDDKSAQAAEATDAGQITFSTPEQAGLALQTAARTDDESALEKILGPESKSILASGDPVEDKASIADFVTKYD